MPVTAVEVAARAANVAELTLGLAPTARRMARLAVQLTLELTEFAARAEKSAQGKTTLLDLPAELRIIIYKLVLTDEEHPGEIILHSYHGRCHTARRQSSKHRSTLCSLLLVNSQIHQEATPILYASNKIIWNASLRPRHISFFLDGIHDNVRHLQSCSIFLNPEKLDGYPGLDDVVEKLCLAPKFDHLTVVIKNSPDLIPSYDDPSYFDDLDDFDDFDHIFDLACTLEPLVACVLTRKTGETTTSSIKSVIRFKQARPPSEYGYFHDFVRIFLDLMADVMRSRTTSTENQAVQS